MSAETFEPAGGPPARDPEELVVSDFGALKALSNPLRMRLLEALSEEPQTVKQLAARLGEAQTKLYRHVRILEKNELVKVDGTRLVSGILERRYRAAARAVRIDRAVLAPGSPPGRADLAGLDIVLKALFEKTRTEIREGVRDGVIDPALTPMATRSLLATRGRLHLTAQQAEDLRRRLIELTQHFSKPGGAGDGTARPDAAGRAETTPHAISLVFYPLERPDGTAPD
jgi:DNA-binding transcriptional ArsR family regulator